MDVWFSVLTTSKLVEQIANQQIYCNPLALEGGCDSGGITNTVFIGFFGFYIVVAMSTISAN